MASSICEGAAKLQVIGAGFGRTGTSSLKSALEEIGYGPCYHMSTVNSNPEHVFTWQSASRRKSVDWKSLFAGYRSTVSIYNKANCKFLGLVYMFENLQFCLSQSLIFVLFHQCVGSLIRNFY
jgi:hypothetical protein